jgi:3D (Asp-Asp-Asp) domain-containing protein
MLGFAGRMSADPPAAPPAATRAAHVTVADVAPPRSTPARARVVEAPVPASPPELRWFGDRLVQSVGTRRMRVTAYSPDERSCAPFADNITASGCSVWTNGMCLVAADTSVLPFDTLLTVPGYADGRIAVVADRGGRIKGDRLDVLMATHEQALEWGVQELDVTIWEPVGAPAMAPPSP